jgi:hypothetical protein
MAAVPEYGITTQYLWDNGIIGLPVAGPPGTPTALVQIYAPNGGKTVSFHLFSFGDPADSLGLPDPDTKSTNEVLISKTVTGAMPTKTPDGAQGWVVDGHFVYQLVEPPADADKLALGINPYDPRMNPDNTWISINGDFTANIIDANPVTLSGLFPFTSTTITTILNVE